MCLFWKLHLYKTTRRLLQTFYPLFAKGTQQNREKSHDSASWPTFNILELLEYEGQDTFSRVYAHEGNVRFLIRTPERIPNIEHCTICRTPTDTNWYVPFYLTLYTKNVQRQIMVVILLVTQTSECERINWHVLRMPPSLIIHIYAQDRRHEEIIELYPSMQ